MPKIDLKAPFWDKNKRLYRPGRDVEVPQEVADALSGKGADTAKQEAQGGATTYPHADIYAAGGFKDWAAVSGASDEQLLAVDGIGPAKLKETRAWKP